LVRSTSTKPRIFNTDASVADGSFMLYGSIVYGANEQQLIRKSVTAALLLKMIFLLAKHFCCVGRLHSMHVRFFIE